MISMLKNKETRNSFIYLGASLFSAFAGFLMIRYFTRHLDPNDFGILGYTSAVNSFILPFITLNLETYFIQKNYNVKEEADKKLLLGSLVLATVIWSVFITALMSVGGSIIFNTAGVKVSFFPYMFFMLLSNIGATFSTYLLFQYRILGKAGLFFAITFIQTVLVLGLGYLFVSYLQWGIYGRILGILMGTFIVGILCLALMNKYMVWVIDKKTIRDGLRFSLPLVPYTIAVLLYEMLDRVFLERYSPNDMSEIGIYNIASQYALVLFMVSLAVYRAFEPMIFKLVSEKNEKRVIRNLIFLNNILLLVALFLVLFSGWLINYLTHGKFNASAEVATLLLVAFYFRSAYIMLNTVLTARENTKGIMWFSLAGVLLITALSIFFVPGYLAIATAWIKIVLYIVLFLCSYLIIGNRKAYLPFVLHTLITGVVLILIIFWFSRLGLINE